MIAEAYRKWAYVLLEFSTDEHDNENRVSMALAPFCARQCINDTSTLLLEPIVKIEIMNETRKHIVRFLQDTSNSDPKYFRSIKLISSQELQNNGFLKKLQYHFLNDYNFYVQIIVE